MVPAYKVGMRSSSTAFLWPTREKTVTGVTVVASDPNPLEDPDTITLSCPASGTVQTRTWFKDNQPIQENGRIFTSPDKAKLTIIRANRNDAGTYKCIASNSFSSGAGVTNVQVYYENCTFRAGAIVGIILGLLIMGLVGGFSGWLFARKAGGLFSNIYPPKSKNGTGRNSGWKSAFDTKTVNSSEYYENVQMDEQSLPLSHSLGLTSQPVLIPLATILSRRLPAFFPAQ
ncbi:uncharacterized protein LOC132386113 [Hypanus sabinus]|uniref:uncharacterized protein LOC132386113 n=1 Tax=Hypanus sabinus TaxID=79690 RepID=UPI0028C48768|nr:uncharacterized protein LOC132386113 [Hypanus sabinus]